MHGSSPEFDYIAWIRRQTAAHPSVVLGIGDDAALLQLGSAADCLVATDMLMEGTHFTFPPATPALAGRKALAVNLSDIAAMAGIPAAAFVAVALPRKRGVDFAHEVHRGIQELAREYGVAIAGGDTNAWDGPLVICVTVIGAAASKGAIPRSGARPGDWIFVTGELGMSLEARHLAFPPRVQEALWLSREFELHAMIDISDGLAADLSHILDESQAGAILDGRRIPISPAAHAANDSRTPLEHALGDGEDFELLFTVSPADGERLLASAPPGFRVTHIGEIVEAGCRRFIDEAGVEKVLPSAGWIHQF